MTSQPLSLQEVLPYSDHHHHYLHCHFHHSHHQHQHHQHHRDSDRVRHIAVRVKGQSEGVRESGTMWGESRQASWGRKPVDNVQSGHNSFSPLPFFTSSWGSRWSYPFF